MYLELICFIGMIILALYFFAENKKPALGIISSLLLLILSGWILADGIQTKTGEVSSVISIQAQNGTETGTEVTEDNTTTVDKIITLSVNNTRNETISGVYEDIPDTPYAKAPEIIGLFLLLLSIYGLAHYIGTTLYTE